MEPKIVLAILIALLLLGLAVFAKGRLQKERMNVDEWYLFSRAMAPHPQLPDILDRQPRKTVLYLYMDGCPYCRAFDPVWSAASVPTDVVALRIDSGDPRFASLVAGERAKGMKGYPFVVSYSSSGVRTPFEGPRTVGALNEFLR